MSQYLVERIYATDEHRRYACRPRSSAAVATTTSSGSCCSNRATGEQETVTANWLYAFIGALPRTDWLGDSIARDGKGFILTGPDVAALDGDGAALAAASAPPFLLETSRPGVFAVGDVRLSSMKRVASAVGEGSSAVSLVHLYLETV